MASVASHFFDQYCRLTSLHGFAFLPFLEYKLKGSVFWWVVILVSMTSAGYLIVSSTREFNQATVSYNLESPTVPLDDVFFPSVVICNMNAIRKSFVKLLMTDANISSLVTEDELTKLLRKAYVETNGQIVTPKEEEIIEKMFQSPVYDAYYEEFVNKTLSLEQVPNFSNVYFENYHSMMDLEEERRFELEVKRGYLLEIASQFRAKDMLINVQFKGAGINYEAGFSTDISETCHWMTPFVRPPGHMNYLTTMVPFARNGLNNGLQMLIDAESYDYALSSSSSEGFELSILHQLDIPIMKNTGIKVKPGFSSQIVVIPTLMNTTLEAKARFTPVERQCYFDDEIELLHFPALYSFRHEISNCLFEATLQKIEEECKCVPKYFLNIIPDVQVCSGVQMICVNQLKEVMGDFRYIMDKGEKKICLTNCIDQRHSVFVTQAAYPDMLSFYQGEDFKLITDKLVLACNTDRRPSLDLRYPNLCKTILSNASSPELNDEVARYAQENIAKVNIFLKDPYVERYIREEKITKVTYVGSIGGILGLFMGFSFVSLVEILYLAYMAAIDYMAGKSKVSAMTFNKKQRF